MIWGFFIHMGYEGNDHCKKQKQYTQAADASYVSFVFNVHYLHTHYQRREGLTDVHECKYTLRQFCK